MLEFVEDDRVVECVVSKNVRGVGDLIGELVEITEFTFITSAPVAGLRDPPRPHLEVSAMKAVYPRTSTPNERDSAISVTEFSRRMRDDGQAVTQINLTGIVAALSPVMKKPSGTTCFFVEMTSLDGVATSVVFPGMDLVRLRYSFSIGEPVVVTDLRNVIMAKGKRHERTILCASRSTKVASVREPPPIVEDTSPPQGRRRCSSERNSSVLVPATPDREIRGALPSICTFTGMITSRPHDCELVLDGSVRVLLSHFNPLDLGRLATDCHTPQRKNLGHPPLNLFTQGTSRGSDRQIVQCPHPERKFIRFSRSVLLQPHRSPPVQHQGRRSFRADTSRPLSRVFCCPRSFPLRGHGVSFLFSASNFSPLRKKTMHRFHCVLRQFEEKWPGAPLAWLVRLSAKTIEEFQPFGSSKRRDVVEQWFCHHAGVPCELLRSNGIEQTSLNIPKVGDLIAELRAMETGETSEQPAQPAFFGTISLSLSSQKYSFYRDAWWWGF